jgi:cytosine/adenosine deaminase-related metal-dependent hydrolase
MDMIKKYILIFSLIFFNFTTVAQTYITNVTIVDVEKYKLLPNQTVVITNDRISRIQSSNSVKLPVNANVVDGKGKFLMPGLVDAHVHFFQNGGLYTRPDAINLTKAFPYEKEIELAHQSMEDKLRRYL